MVEEILKAAHLMQICSPHNWEQEFKKLVMKYHPDKWNDPRATDVISKLTGLKQDFIKGWNLTDDNGVYISNGYVHSWIGDEKVRKLCTTKRKEFFKKLSFVYEKDALNHFLKYLCPEPATENNTQTKIITDKRFIPLSKVHTLLQSDPNRYRHVNWIFSRMVEFCAMTSSIEINHMGINPDSVFIDPKDHSIKVMTFYHSTPFGKKIETISGRWSTFYPADVFAKKISFPGIDITLAKKTAIYLLGDNSGSGVMLRRNKDINPHVLEYLMTPETDGRDAMPNWRKVLKNNFKSEFLTLNI